MIISTFFGLLLHFRFFSFESNTVFFFVFVFFQINTKCSSLKSILFPLKVKSLVFCLPTCQKQTIDLSFLPPSPEWSLEDSVRLGLYYFFKISCLVCGWKPSGALLSQTLITDSHNSQPVDSHQQTPLGVSYTPFFPLFPIHPSTHLLPLVLDK